MATQTRHRLTKTQAKQMQKMVVYCLEHLEVESDKRAFQGKKGLRVLQEFIPGRSFGWLSYAARGRWDQIAPTKSDYEAISTVYRTVSEFTKRGKRISKMAIEFSKAMAQVQYLGMELIEDMAKYG